MPINSKDIVMTFAGIVGAILIGLIFKYFELRISKDNLTIVIYGVVILIIIISIVYKKIGEISKELEAQSKVQQRLEKDLERARDLVELKAEDKYLKDKIIEIEKRILRDGNKK